MCFSSQKGLEPIASSIQFAVQRPVHDREHAALAKGSMIVFLTSYFICKSNPDMGFNVTTLHISVK